QRQQRGGKVSRQPGHRQRGDRLERQQEHVRDQREPVRPHQLDQVAAWTWRRCTRPTHVPGSSGVFTPCPAALTLRVPFDLANDTPSMTNAAAITLAHRVSRSDQVMFQELDGEAVLLDLSGEAYFGLNGVGTRIWALMEGSPALAEGPR